MSESFQTLRGSLMRRSSRRVCSLELTSSQYFSSSIPESTIAFSNDGTSSRNLARPLDAAPRPPGLLLGAALQPVLQQQHPRIDHRLLERRHQLQEPLGLLRLAEAHHPLDTGAVGPAAVEDHDLAGGREMRNIALHVHL